MNNYSGMPRAWSEQHIRELVRREITSGSFSPDTLTSLIKNMTWDLPVSTPKHVTRIYGTGLFGTYVSSSSVLNGQVWGDLHITDSFMKEDNFVEFNSGSGTLHCNSTYVLGEISGKIKGYTRITNKIYEREENNLVVYLYDKNSETIFDVGGHVPLSLFQCIPNDLLGTIKSSCGNRYDETRIFDFDGSSAFMFKISDYVKSKIFELFPESYPSKMIVKGIIL